MVVKLTAFKGERKDLTIGTAYLLYDTCEPTPTTEMDAHHITCGRSSTNARDEYLLQFIVANNLYILSIGNKTVERYHKIK